MFKTFASGSESQAGRITESAVGNGQLENTAGPVESIHFPRTIARDIQVAIGPKNHAIGIDSCRPLVNAPMKAPVVPLKRKIGSFVLALT